MSIRHSYAVPCLAAVIVLGVAAFRPSLAQANVGFQPVSAEELKMTSEPLAPGAPAIILFRQVDRSDDRYTPHEDNYLRIKILTEEGRKNADVEIVFSREYETIVGIRARTIKPDGTIAEFDGKVFEKYLIKGRGIKVLAKTFTLPSVEVGSIIEYYYTIDFKEHYVYDSHWVLSEELFTKSARFSLKPFTDGYNQFHLRWSWQDLPKGSDPKQNPRGIVEMQASNVPGFQDEDFMPPGNELKARVDFIYDEELPESNTDKFWKKIDKKRNSKLESFVGKNKGMEEAVRQIVSPDDAPEVKLRKIYDRVLQIRNTSYELQKTDQEAKRDKEKSDDNVEDVWKRGYGDSSQITWLYLALVRAAGFEAYGCSVSDRQNYFFAAVTMQSAKLNADVVLVKLNGKELYFEPGAKFAPFGLLAWSETGVQGLRLDKDGGTWIHTTLPQSAESQVQRKAELKLSDTGDLEGKLIVTYIGLEAMQRRLEERNVDDVERKKYIEDDIKEQVPAAAELELTNKPDWSGTETPLVAEMDIKIPGWASNAGKRALLPVGLFSAHEKRVFEHANRVHPIYFEYPYQKVDDVSIQLPVGWQVTSVPPPQNKDAHIISYDLKVENNNGNLHVVRKLNVDILLLDPKYYTALRNFFQLVRSGDEEQVLLQPGIAVTSTAVTP